MVIFDISTERNVNVTVTEKVYQGDNKISQFHTNLPSVIGDEKHDVSTCTCEMRCYILDDDYISYNIPTASLSYKTDITIDITEKAQTVPVMFIFEKDGVIVAKTKRVYFSVSAAPPKDRNPLTPREQFDRVINEQRATIAEQEETITEQAGTIGSQGERITELSGEVAELTTENTRLENQHTADQNTIQHLIDNPPGARLQSKSVTPTASMQVVEPDSDYQGLSTVTVGAVTPPRLQSKQVAPSESTTYVTADSDYDGLSSVTVDNVTASIDPNIQPENIKKDVVIVGVEGTYDPFPEHSVGGIYITKVDEDGYPVKYLIKDYERTLNPFPIFFDKSTNAVRALKEIDFENCPEIVTLPDSYFSSLIYLEKVTLPEKLQIIPTNAFENCINLKNIIIPQETIRIKTSAFEEAGIIDLIVPSNVSVIEQYAFRWNSSIKTAILEHGVSYLAGRIFESDSNLSHVYLPNTITFIGDSLFLYAKSLEILELENGFNCNGLNFSSSTRFTAETIVACLEALADRTGQTAYTITFGGTNLNKLTNEQKAIAINKNWNLA